MDSEPEGCYSSTENLNSPRTWDDDKKNSLIPQSYGQISTRKKKKYRYIWHGLSYIIVILLTTLISTIISTKGRTGSECSCSLDVTSPSGNLQAGSGTAVLASDATVEKTLLNEIEVQKVWDALAKRSDGVTAVVSEKFGYERGILPESPRVTRNGVSGFLATLDSMHQAHCVDAAWRRLWFNHEDDKLNGPMAKFNISDEWYKNHISLKTWNKSNPDDFIHFEKNYLCKNYTDVLGWIKNY